MASHDGGEGSEPCFRTFAVSRCCSPATLSDFAPATPRFYRICQRARASQARRSRFPFRPRQGDPRRVAASSRSQYSIAGAVPTHARKLQVVETTAKLFFRGLGTQATMRNHCRKVNLLLLQRKRGLPACHVTKLVTADRTSEQFPQVRCDRNCHPTAKFCHHRDFKELGHKAICPPFRKYASPQAKSQQGWASACSARAFASPRVCGRGSDRVRFCRDSSQLQMRIGFCTIPLQYCRLANLTPVLGCC